MSFTQYVCTIMIVSSQASPKGVGKRVVHNRVYLNYSCILQILCNYDITIMQFSFSRLIQEHILGNYRVGHSKNIMRLHKHFSPVALVSRHVTAFFRSISDKLSCSLLSKINSFCEMQTISHIVRSNYSSFIHVHINC